MLQIGTHYRRASVERCRICLSSKCQRSTRTSPLFKLAAPCHINNPWRLEVTLLPTMMLHHAQIYHWLATVCCEHQTSKSPEVTWDMAHKLEGATRGQSSADWQEGQLRSSRVCNRPWCSTASLISRWGCLWPIRESPVWIVEIKCPNVKSYVVKCKTANLS